jgi:hypothetical protein
MGIGEPDALFCQAVNVRRFYFRFRIEATDIPVTQVVGQDKNDVGILYGMGWQESGGCQ